MSAVLLILRVLAVICLAPLLLVAYAVLTTIRVVADLLRDDAPNTWRN